MTQTIIDIREQIIAEQNALVLEQERQDAAYQESQRQRRTSDNVRRLDGFYEKMPQLLALPITTNEGGIYLLLPECCPVEIRGPEWWIVGWGKDLENYRSGGHTAWTYKTMGEAVVEARRLWIEIDTQEKAWALEAERQAERDAAWVKAQEELQAAGPVEPQDVTSRMMRAQEATAKSMAEISTSLIEISAKMR